MTETAKLVVSSGPDRGAVFSLNEELMHVGKGADNQFVLTDDSLMDHQASIVNRAGRYAIYTPMDLVISVDGSPIPAERWIWLPATARIQLSDLTTLQFTNGKEPAEPASEEPEQTGAPEAGPKVAKFRASKPKAAATKSKAAQTEKSKKKTRAVAKFITDQKGDPLVKLGEDGHLPELSLTEPGQQQKQAEKRKKQEGGSPAIYVAVGLSLLCSLAMLFMEADFGGTSAAERALARKEIKEFYGKEGETLAPYQRLLREAQLAHSRRDHAHERMAYRKVLDLLNAEDKNRFSGLTGDPDDDDRLHEFISTILRK